ncbi:hypothetical protein [Polynucleobacter ibericus]|uniref:hypothetical protein n=1 Tax=Polynucleobacter ibericus TaxID=1819725 RepID=UPI001BFD5679|nr:hypothetical protein [Polynucleobacter ibericus]QWE07870.1 hypothetical protein AOC20_05350 [Polynucleobacter ibericus]
MSKDKRGLKDVEFADKIKTQIFKQFQQERLIKEDMVIPASMLAAAKNLELRRTRDFENSIEDEKRHRRTAKLAPVDKINTPPLTRERFEE